MIIPVDFLNSISANFLVKYHLNKEIGISRITAIAAVAILYVCLIPLYGVWGGVISSMLYFVVQLAMNLSLLRYAEAKCKRLNRPIDTVFAPDSCLP